ncbi:MAG: two-component system response regulator [Vulcanimicrobiaceae bacterium]
MQVFAVDDATVNLRIYEKMLQSIRGVDVTTFSKPTEALEYSQNHQPDLLIVDFRMPEMDGVELIKHFRLIPGYLDIPIIMLTGEQDAEIRRRAIEAGASDFLNKPADPVEFSSRVRNLLELRQRRKELADRAQHLASEVRAATREIALRERETINRLSRAAEFRDNETGMHIVRMGRFAQVIGRALGLGESEAELLLLAAPMHDIGKVATPDAILLKPGKLTPDEWTIMKQHTTAGYEILKDSASTMLQKGAEIALTHHEKWDGSGYPNGIAGDAIPISGRICAISDVFDALTSVRPYKPAWPAEQAIIHIHQSSGTHFDPDLVKVFERVLPEINDIRAQLTDREEALT